MLDTSATGEIEGAFQFVVQEGFSRQILKGLGQGKDSGLSENPSNWSYSVDVDILSKAERKLKDAKISVEDHPELISFLTISNACLEIHQCIKCGVVQRMRTVRGKYQSMLEHATVFVGSCSLFFYYVLKQEVDRLAVAIDAQSTFPAPKDNSGNTNIRGWKSHTLTNHLIDKSRTSSSSDVSAIRSILISVIEERQDLRSEDGTVTLDRKSPLHRAMNRLCFPKCQMETVPHIAARLAIFVLRCYFEKIDFASALQMKYESHQSGSSNRSATNRGGVTLSTRILRLCLKVIETSSGGDAGKSKTILCLGEFLEDSKTRFKHVFSSSENGRQVVVYFFSHLMEEERAGDLNEGEIRIIEMTKKRLGLQEIEYVQYHDSRVVIK